MKWLDEGGDKKDAITLSVRSHHNQIPKFQKTLDNHKLRWYKCYEPTSVVYPQIFDGEENREILVKWLYQIRNEDVLGRAQCICLTHKKSLSQAT